MNTNQDEYSTTKYWPFEVQPSNELSQHAKLVVEFLERAYAEGFSPCESDYDSFQLSKDNRGARIIHRGRQRLELLLGDIDKTELSAFVKDFPAAADASLMWMRGESVSKIVERLQNHLATMPKGMENLRVARTE